MKLRGRICYGLFMFAGSSARTARRWDACIAPAALFFAALAVRLIPWNRTLVGWDEAILTTVSSRWALQFLPERDLYQLIVPTSYSYPSLWFWLNGILVRFLGPAPFVWRLATVLSDAGCVAMIFVIGRRVGGSWAAWAAGLLACSGLFLVFHDTVTIEYLLCLWILLSVYLFLRCIEENHRGFLLAAVFFGSMACFTKYHGVVYLFVLCVLLIVIPQTRAMVKGKYFWAFAATALFLPCVMLAQNGLTWYMYGWEKTHIDEVLTVMNWRSYVSDFRGDGFIQPKWHYYFVFCWHNLGPLLCVLGIAGIGGALLRPRRDRVLLLAIIACWMLWTSIGNPKNARYCLAAVYLFLLFPGFLLARLVQWSRLVPITLLAAAVAVASWGTAHRVSRYLESSRNRDLVYDTINARTEQDAVVFTDSLCFQHFAVAAPGPLERELRFVDGPAWQDRADVLIVHDLAYEMYKAGAIATDKAYLAERETILAEWNLLADVGDGSDRVRVLEKPKAAFGDLEHRRSD